MLNLLKKLWNSYVIRSNDYFTIQDTDIDAVPFHIKQIGRMYPMLNTPDNESRGEIKKFEFGIGFNRTFKTGDTLHTELCSETKNYMYVCIWKYLGDNYFKLISKL